MTRTIAKLQSDFAGAFPFAGEFFDMWVFTHNAKDGRLASWLVFEIQRLRQAHPHPDIETLGYEELLSEVLSLNEGVLIDLFGPFPTQGDFLALSFEDIKPILQFVAAQQAPADPGVSPVPRHKLEYNKLGEDARVLILNGMWKAPLVRQYLDGHPDKELAAKVANVFRAKYEKLRAEKHDPDSILYELQIEAQGPYIQRSKQAVAALAVLAYLFEECDIFERPPS